MEEHITELIPDWCDGQFDVELARNVDKYESTNRFATVSEKKTIKNNILMYKTDTLDFVSCSTF